MADIIDEANEMAMAQNESLALEAQRRAAAIPKGHPGECIDCGEHSPRLVNGKCAPCRDEIERK